MTGGCPRGSEPEFPPVRDLHVGIVSSSLGGIGSQACSNAAGARREDDRGHLVARAPDGSAVGASQPEGFLAYLPNVAENSGRPRAPDVVGAVPIEDPSALLETFQKLVIGVGEAGCGYEAQLESVYRFLVQPDPYERVVRNGGVVELQGVDYALLEQRKRFLRPDSLVAVVMVSDENESTIDPRTYGGTAWHFLEQDALPPGTEICLTDPDNAGCTSCAAAKSDPRCQREPTLAGDHPNLRFFDPKRRYGVDPRYPLDRYVRGLSEGEVPDRSGDQKHLCTNPLFARDLPSKPGDSLCALPRSVRSPREVLFAVVGGIPWQLLTDAPTDLSAKNPAPFKESLSESDWTMLLGPKGGSRRFEGAHPLLRESIVSRGIAPDGAHDREWNTRGADLQYACTFELPVAKNCQGKPDSCDCSSDTDSPLCDPANPRQQVRGKAYPTLSTLSVARSLGDRAVVASICPREVRNKASEVYGYRPAMRALLGRIADGLRASCVPPLHPDEDGKVRCVLLEAQPEAVTACDSSRGRKSADPQVVARLRNESAGVLEGRTVCDVNQIDSAARGAGKCADASAPGFCYVTGDEAGKGCSQALSFSKLGASLAGSTLYLQCIDSREDEAPTVASPTAH